MRIEIDMANVKEDSLTEFIVSLENIIPGCKVIIREVFYLDVDDPKAAAILQSLFGGKVEKPKEEKKHRKQILYTVKDGVWQGEDLRGSTVGKLMKARKLEPGTHLSHPKKGEFVVSADGRALESLQ